MRDQIGFIGFGEVASCFSEAMSRTGAMVTAYDVIQDDTERGKELRERISLSGARAGSLSWVIERSDYVLSTVTTQAAKNVALSCTGLLRTGQFYVDLNSTSPSAKNEIAHIITSSGAEFVEGAILGAVGATGSKTRILLGGRKAPEAAETLARCGLRCTAYSAEIGKASTFKMLRSIFSKGLESLILELLIAGKHAGIDRDLWDDVSGFMASRPFDEIAANWVRTHATAYDRRYYEMAQVVETLDEMGVNTIMTDATVRFFERSLSLGFEEVFSGKTFTYRDVIDFMESHLGRQEWKPKTRG